MEENILLKTAELSVPARRGGLIPTTFLYNFPKNRGAIFAISCLNKPINGDDRLDRIIQSHLDYLGNALKSPTNSARKFEQTLTDLNRALGQAYADLGITSGQVSAAFGLVDEKQLFFAALGPLQATFLQRAPNKRFNVFNLHHWAERQALSFEKPFHTLLDGDILPGDVFAILTNYSKDNLSNEEFNNILVSLPPQSSLQRIKQFIGPLDGFGGIVIQSYNPSEEIGPPKKMNAIDSLSHLSATKDKTANIMGEITGEAKTVALGLHKKIESKLSATGERSGNATFKRMLAVVIKAIIAVSLPILKKLWSLIAPKLKGIFKIRATKTNIAIGILVGSIVIGGLIFIIGQKKDDESARQVFDATAARIEEKLVTAEAGLIYNNTAQARTNLNDASAALAALVTDSDAQDKRKSELQAKIETIRKKMLGVTSVNPTLAGKLTDSTNLTQAVILHSGSLVIASNLSLYEINSETKTLTSKNNVNGSIAQAQSIAREGDNTALILDVAGRLDRLDSTANVINPVKSGLDSLVGPQDIAAYNSSVYVLLPGTEQIVKLRATADGFDNGSPWITARTDSLKNAKSIAIDGSVWVLLNDSIIKFLAGKQETWEHDQFDPALSSPTDLWTDVNSQWLYILDPKENRIIVVTKENGRIVAQYESELIKSTVSFTVDEPNRLITIYTTNEAYEFTPDHLLK